MLLVIHQEYHLFQFWLTIEKKKKTTQTKQNFTAVPIATL